MFFTLHKSHFQVDQSPQHKRRHTESNSRERGKLSRTDEMGLGDFLNRAPVPQALRSRIDKLDLIKLESLHTAKDTINRTIYRLGNISSLTPNPIEG